MSGIVQRLVQKEKEVLQLQTDLDKLRAQQHPGDRDSVYMAVPNLIWLTQTVSG